MVCGIDEAGRGPIIGELVLCGVLIEEGKESELKELGVKDSKLLTPKQRTSIAKVLEKKYKFHRIAIAPAEIDSAVEKNYGLNLN
ncbi:ribonuclease HII, partial [Candidatus Woesearchaeota archaeon]|nr:ribonuclease HII [Candidatus Woesearchaeota archaeon]